MQEKAVKKVSQFSRNLTLGLISYEITKVFFPNTLTLGSLIPVRLVWGLSKTRKAAKLAVYEATMIIANPAHTMPSTRAEKLRGVPKKNICFNFWQIREKNWQDIMPPLVLFINYLTQLRGMGARGTVGCKKEKSAKILKLAKQGEEF